MAFWSDIHMRGSSVVGLWSYVLFTGFVCKFTQRLTVALSVCLFRPVVLNHRQFCALRDIWQCVSAFLVVITVGLLLASRRGQGCC